MSEGSEQAPADWYDDPASPGRMRYFDGHGWTNHYHEPGKLPSIGSWLNTTFSVFGLHWKGAAVLSVLVALVGNVATWFGFKAIVGDLAVVDEELVNADATVVVGGLLIVGFMLLWQGFGWLSMSRYMQRAHFQAAPTVSDAVRHGLRRLPRYLLFTITLGIAALIIVTLLSAIAVISPVLGVLLYLVAIVVAVWVAVKLAFLVTAIAVASPDGSPITASAEVSSGRFWPVLGRLLLLVVGLWIATIIITASLGSVGQLFDAETFQNSFAVRDNSWTVDDFRFADLLPSTGQLTFAIIVNSVVQAASNVVSTSAFVRLYLDSGGPSEL